MFGLKLLYFFISSIALVVTYASMFTSRALLITAAKDFHRMHNEIFFVCQQSRYRLLVARNEPHGLWLSVYLGNLLASSRSKSTKSCRKHTVMIIQIINHQIFKVFDRPTDSHF
jgi:hypothetical protein